MPSEQAGSGDPAVAQRGGGGGSNATQLLLHTVLLRPLVKAVFGAATEGRRRLRDLDQFILVANHNSHLDLPLLFQLLPAKQIPRTHPLAAYEYFARSRPLFRTVERLFRPVWLARPDPAPPAPEPMGSVARGAAPRRAGDAVSVEAAMTAMAAHLEAGHSVVIFPEGTRGEPGRMARFRRGVGRLAEAFPNVPVVPVHLSGPERALPKTSGVPMPLWTRAMVGEPKWPAWAGSGSNGADVAGQIAADLEAEVRGLAESEQARRHRRYVRPGPGPTVAVLGIDGSGKSTLSRSLAQGLSGTGTVAVVSDELAFHEDGEGRPLRPPALELFRRALSRRVKRAKSLKSYKVPKMVELLLRDRVTRQVKRWYRPRALVLDGCPALNMAAWARMYGADVDDETCAAALRVLTAAGRLPTLDAPLFQRFPELRHLVRFRLAPLVRPDAVFFLDVPPAVAMDRIRSRGEAVQAHETEAGLHRLREGYLAVCRVLEPALGVPTRVLGGGGTPEEIAATARRALADMLDDRAGQGAGGP